MLAGLHSPLWDFFIALSVAAFGAEAFALVDAVTRPAGAFVAVGKQTKVIWLLILGVAAAIGLFYALYSVSVVSFLPVASFVAAAVYLTDVRPKVKGFRGGGGGGNTHMGPYGPW
jgi:Protein of unknown function (DUF2516)